MRIVVNPAHWNKRLVEGREVVESGPSGLVSAKERCLVIANNLVAKLQARGIDARLTPADNSLTLDAIIAWANDLHGSMAVDLLISIHCDAMDNPAANGCAAYFGEGHSEQAAIGNLISAELARATGLRNKGAISDRLAYGGRLAILQETRMLAILLECGFVTNAADVAIIRDHPEQIADGIISGVGRYFMRGPCAAPADYPLLGPPSISFAQFQRVLSEHNSPVTPAAQECWEVISAAGIDPTVALAFFGKESTLGTQGRPETLANHNWGNLRGDRSGGGGFQRFASWQDGLRAWCQHLLSPTYTQATPPLDTICKIVPLYAPSSDGNDENQYILDLYGMISKWRQQSEAGGGSPTLLRDYPVAFQGRPCITRSRFQSVLQAQGSPLADAAFDLYNACVQNGVDPAVALAFFMLESNCGTAGGDLLQNQNWGNVRGDGGGVRGLQQFASWQAGLVYWCNRLRTVYAALGKLTISQVVPTYRPYKAQVNGDPWYIQQLQTLIAPWDAEAAQMMAVLQ